MSERLPLSAENVLRLFVLHMFKHTTSLMEVIHPALHIFLAFEGFMFSKARYGDLILPALDQWISDIWSYCIFYVIFVVWISHLCTAPSLDGLGWHLNVCMFYACPCNQAQGVSNSKSLSLCAVCIVVFLCIKLSSDTFWIHIFRDFAAHSYPFDQ